MALRRISLLFLTPLLSGCVAVAALPLLAGGAMVTGGHFRIKAATPRPKIAPALAPRAAAERTGGMPVDLAAGTGVVITNLTALPPPDVVSAGTDPWRPFVDWSLARAGQIAADREPRSVLYDTASGLALPLMQRCRAKVPAVVIDLDPAGGVFAPAAGLSAPPGLAAGLARLREAGTAVLWISALPAGRVGEVGEALRQSGLDPEGSDPLLLGRTRDDRKQVLREDASKDVCVIAIAGDRKADFDEMFDYLRNPANEQSFDILLGAGWFLTPPPLG